MTTKRSLQDLLRPLTPDEIERFIPLSPEDVDAALKRGRDERRRESEFVPAVVVPPIPFA